MNGLDKTWLADTFDIGAVLSIESAGMGQSNPLGIARLLTATGTYAVKRYQHPPSQIALQIEYAAWSAGCPLPMPIPTRTGERIAQYRDASPPLWVHVYRWVDGEPIAWHTVEPRLAHDMGGLLAAMHAIPVEASLKDEAGWKPLMRAGWNELVEQAITQDIAWAGTLQQKVAALVNWEELILANAVDDELAAPSQRDLHPPNVIRQPDGAYAVIDWDAAGPVNAREDVAMFALVWATPETGRPSQETVRAFIRGYRDAGGHFQSRGLADLMQRERSRLAWIAYNVRRDVSEHPGAHAWLTPALLAGVQNPTLHELAEMAALFADAT